METWIIISKLAILGFLAASFIDAAIPNIPWAIFSILLFLCINIAIYIVKQETLKKILILLSMVHIAISFRCIQPLFLLLMPLSIYEGSIFFLRKKIVRSLFALAPVIWLDGKIAYLYVLVGVFSVMIFTITEKYTERLVGLECQLDQMRRAREKLSKSLNDNKEFIRQSEYTFKLEERNRLAQLFHDKIGHTITGALIQMEASKRLLGTDQEKAQELLQNAINISKMGIENIRVTLKNMKPPTEQMGINRLRLFIDDFSEKQGIQILFHYKGNMEIITPIQWKIIQENMTEAMTNVLKYAQATVISVEIHVLNTMVKAEVKDNGKGVGKMKKGLGIIGMEERTASINGKVIVDGTDGFSVTMLLPILG